MKRTDFALLNRFAKMKMNFRANPKGLSLIHI